MAGLSSPGIGSGLDIQGILDKLMAAESRAPRAALAKKEASYQAKLSAYGGLSGALASLQSALGSLNNQSTFKAMNATSSDTSIFTASATSSAGIGSYNINVTKLAQAQTLSAAGQASTTATIGSGTATTVTFQFGTSSGGIFTQNPNQPSGSVTIDNTNNSLQGIRDAINKANIGVSASIVSDGSATNPYHLVIKSNKTGEESSMQISVESGGDAALASLLSFDASGTTMTETSKAQNAALTVNGIAVTSQTNSVSGAIEGTSLELLKTGTSNLNVARNTTSVKSSVDAFVKAFNDVSKTIRQLTSYNAETKQGGPLIGDSAVRSIEAELRKMLSSPVNGSNSTLKTLRDVGISISKEGVMSVDSTKLSAAMSKDLDDVAALFSSVGKTTDSLVSFVSAEKNSTPGEYEVSISKLATQGKVAGSQNLTLAPITINASNRDLTITVDGTSASIALTQGAYTSAEIASLVQSAVNGASEFSSKGIAVSATIDASGNLNIISNKYGSISKVSVTGSSVAALMGTATATDGIDVTGTIGGVAAKGDGQFLIGAEGSPTAGLKLQITGGAVPTPPATTISRGLINFSKGYAFHLDKLVEGFLGNKGLLSSRTDGLKNSIKDIGKQNEALEARLANTEARYRKQFVALDATISKMNSTSTYLAQQLASLSKSSGQ